MQTSIHKIICLVMLFALGLISSACAPSGNADYTYNSGYSSSGTYDPTAFTRMNIGR